MTNDEFIRQIFDELLTNLHNKIENSSKFVKIRQDFVNIRQRISHEIVFYSDE